LHSAIDRLLADHLSPQWASSHPSVLPRRVTANYQHLVLLSGDGNDTDYAASSSFPRLVERALHRGWTVEVWCSSPRSGAQIYRKMEQLHRGLTLHCVSDELPALVLPKGSEH
jgi:hypothetical protein